ncbi:TPA: UDP-N-acetylmuramoyl-tripeptide--D-alanyl-D-alanine ligase [Candidatus Poribacteria bacterium]|nr:UDP-N-acetylmuramoyl-tripeptide--D-alanyl-D-alanine ligase [Candidatus Poribacteria bacterium]
MGNELAFFVEISLSFMHFTVSEIVGKTGGRLVRGEHNFVINAVSTDSRTLASGDLFVAIIGENFDGHDFVSHVEQNGAIGAVVSRASEIKLPVVIEVRDTLVAYGEIANLHRNRFDVPIVAITGSNGKTTTKDMVAEVLAQRCSVFKSEKNFNNRIGIPNRLLQLSAQDEVGVLEIGSNQPGEIKHLSGIVEPDVAVITNIGFSHLEFLGSIEGVFKEKSAILENVDLAILSADDVYTERLRREFPVEVVTFGYKHSADVSASNIRIDNYGKPRFRLQLDHQDVEDIRLPCAGAHNISNALAAACVGKWAGLTHREIRIGLENFSPPDMRLQWIELDDFNIINDAYNSNPNSVQVALGMLSDTHIKGKRIAVLGDMLELGAQSAQLHFEVGRCIRPNVKTLITVGNCSRQIADGIQHQMASIDHCYTADEAADALRRVVDLGDLVLLKGSRGIELEKILRGFL